MHARDNKFIKLKIYQDHVHYNPRKIFFLQIELFVPGIVYLILLYKLIVLIVSKIGLINTGIILSSNITGRLTPPERRQRYQRYC